MKHFKDLFETLVQQLGNDITKSLLCSHHAFLKTFQKHIDCLQPKFEDLQDEGIEKFNMYSSLNPGI